MARHRAIRLSRGLLRRFQNWKTIGRQPHVVKWPQTAANIFDLIYKGDGGINRSPRPARMNGAGN
jgi:hypothetical protein